MHSGKNRDRLLCNVDTGEDGSRFGYTGETLVQDFWGKMAKLEVDVILLRTNTTAFANFYGHTTGHDVTGSKILCGRSVTFHEPLTLRI